MTSVSRTQVDVQTAARQWRRRVAGLLWCRQTLRLTAGYLFAWGVTILLLRVVWDTDRLPLLWGVAGLAGLMAIAAWQVSRRLPDPQAIEAMLDSHNQAGGLYMAHGQTAGWEDRMSPPRLPALRWQSTRAWGLAVAGIVFVLLTLVTPRWVTRQVQAQPMDVTGDVAQLQAQLQTLEEQRVLQAEQAHELSQKLEQIRRDADGRDPVKTWESLDHVRSRVQDAAAQAVEQTVAQAQEMTQAQQLADALRHDADALRPDQLAQAMQTLQAMARDAAAENEALRQALDQAGLDLSAEALSQQQLEALAQALNLSAEQLMQQLQQLSEAGLCDGQSLAQCQAMRQGIGQPGGSQSLARALAEHMDEMAVQDILVAMGSLGSGGVSRGPGDAPMTWNDTPSSGDGTAFEDQILPPAELAAIRDSQRVGLGATAPKAETDQAASSGGVLPAQDASGSGAHQAILPQHRAAVKKYFQRDQ